MLHSEEDLFHRTGINDVTPQSCSCIDVNRSVSRDDFFVFLFKKKKLCRILEINERVLLKNSDE